MRKGEGGYAKIHNSMEYGGKKGKKEHCLHRLEYLIFSPKFAKIRMIQKLIIKIRNCGGDERSELRAAGLAYMRVVVKICSSRNRSF